MHVPNLPQLNLTCSYMPRKITRNSLNFNFCSVTVKLNYVGQTACSDILFATHQIAKYSSGPQQEHGGAILYLTRHLCLKFCPEPNQGFEYHCDADFSEIRAETLHSLTLAQLSLEVDG
ncbi:hypothetical protein ACHAW6_006114 [Cyclotella cf. meneghiniana]